MWAELWWWYYIWKLQWISYKACAIKSFPNILPSSSQKNGSIPWTHYFTSSFLCVTQKHNPRRENSLTKVFVGNFADNDVFQSDAEVIVIDSE